MYKKFNLVKWLSLLILILIVAAGAWLTQKYHLVFDWSRDNRNTLTKTSQDILQQVNKPLLVTVLANKAASERRRLRVVIEKYQRYKKDIELVFLDTDEQLPQAKELQLNNHGQLRLDYQEQFEIIDQISEREITNALQRLTRAKKPWVVFLTGHGERDIFNEENQGYSTLRQTLDTSGIQAQDLNLLETTSIPNNISVLVIAAPQTDLLAGEEQLIVDYVKRGGSLLWLHEPNQHGRLHKLAEELGVSWVDGTIIDANQQLRSILGIQHPAVVPVVEYQAHSITKALTNQTLYPFAVGLEFNAESIWQTQPLFYSLPRAWSETEPLSKNDAVFNTEDGDTAGPLLMAAALTRIIESNQQRVVIIGDSDFIANGYIGNGENLALSVSVLQWLVHDDKRISLLPYRAPDSSIEFSNLAIVSLASSYLLIVPLGVLLTGIIIGIRRRKL